MTRVKKRLLIGGTVVLLLGLGAGFLFFRSTRQALLRAEAFKFRRMQVVRLAEEGAYRFFYITNRAPGAGDGTLEDRFSNQREEKLRFGSYDVQIEPSLSLAVIFDPSKWFRNEEIDIREERELERAELVGQLREIIQESPHRSLLVIVHGYREQFPSALRKTAFVSHMLDINTPVLLFDWPGDQPGGPRAAYLRAVEVAEASGVELAQTLELIIREIQPERLWLVANSMGGQVVADAFHLLFEQGDLADAEPELEDVVLTAPDVGLDEFNNQFKQEISALTRHLTVYVSSNDRALLASRIVNRGMRRGESTLDSRDINQEQLEEAIRLAEMIEPDSDAGEIECQRCDFLGLGESGLRGELRQLDSGLFLRLVNPETPRTRPLYPIHSGEGTVYWVLTRGR